MVQLVHLFHAARLRDTLRQPAVKSAEDIPNIASRCGWNTVSPPSLPPFLPFAHPPQLCETALLLESGDSQNTRVRSDLPKPTWKRHVCNDIQGAPLNFHQISEGAILRALIKSTSAFRPRQFNPFVSQTNLRAIKIGILLRIFEIAHFLLQVKICYSILAPKKILQFLEEFSWIWPQEGNVLNTILFLFTGEEY